MRQEGGQTRTQTQIQGHTQEHTQEHTKWLDALRDRIARVERGQRKGVAGTIPFGIAALDAHLPTGGLVRGALHEIAGEAAEIEHGAAATLWIAGVLARMKGQVLWAVERRDLFAPALAAAGLSPERVVFVEAGKSVLLAMEEGLRHRGLGGVVGEVTKLGLTPSRRLQLAAEASGVTAFILRRSRVFEDQALTEPIGAVTRWRIACLPSPPPLPAAPDTPGLARARWQLNLLRCRGGEPASWIVEACDAKGRLHLAADLADRPAARRAAGW